MVKHNPISKVTISAGFLLALLSCSSLPYLDRNTFIGNWKAIGEDGKTYQVTINSGGDASYSVFSNNKKEANVQYQYWSLVASGVLLQGEEIDSSIYFHYSRMLYLKKALDGELYLTEESETKKYTKET